MTHFKPGDTVVALTHITRVDHACGLAVGKTAKVISVSKGTRDDIEIIDIELPDGNRMINIACTGKYPLEKVL